MKFKKFFILVLYSYILIALKTGPEVFEPTKLLARVLSVSKFTEMYVKNAC